jgi:aldose 1-epimerase
MDHAFRGSSQRLLAVLSASTIAVAAVALLGMASPAVARSAHVKHKLRQRAADSPGISSQNWGMAHGQTVNLYTLTSGSGMTVKITNYGGIVQSIWVPDRQGNVADVALGFGSLSDYVNDFENQPWPAAGGSGDTYFGAIIGRYANRIGFDAANGHAGFTLNGTFYPTPENNGQNTLHGGPLAYNTQVWAASTSSGPGFARLKLTYTDPDGYNGFPGAVSNTVTYTLTTGNALRIKYRATTTAPTVVNFTNHTYFNLAGEGSGTIYDQLLKINANTFTPVDTNLIPTGVFAPVARTPFDFRTMKPIGQDIRRADMPQGDQLVIAHGYDHNWVLNGSGLRLASVAEDPASGRTLTTYTTEPGVQLYTSNFLVGDLVGSSGRIYRQGDGFTLETQHYPDSPHHQGDPNWPSVVLNPGQVFNSRTIYKFGIAASGHTRRRG